MKNFLFLSLVLSSLYFVSCTKTNIQKPSSPNELAQSPDTSETQKSAKFKAGKGLDEYVE